MISFNRIAISRGRIIRWWCIWVHRSILVVRSILVLTSTWWTPTPPTRTYKIGRGSYESYLRICISTHCLPFSKKIRKSSDHHSDFPCFSYETMYEEILVQKKQHFFYYNLYEIIQSCIYQISTCYHVNSFLKKCIQFLIIVRSIQINEREKKERGKKGKRSDEDH